MPLPSLNFQRVRRDPSLVEQAIVGTLTDLVRKKFITDPAERERQEFEEEQRLAKQKFTVSERTAGEKAATTLARRRTVEFPQAALKLEEERQLSLLPFPDLGPLGEVQVRAIKELDPSFVPDEPSGTRREQELRFEARESILEDLLNQARTAAVVDATKQRRTIDRSDTLIRLGATAPNLLVTDSETSKERMALPDESAAYVVGTTAIGDILEQYGDDPDTQDIVRDYQQRYTDIGAGNFRLAPTFDVAAFNEYLNRLTGGDDPDATKFGTLLGAAAHLEQLNLLKDDAGNLIQYPEQGGEGTLVSKMQGGTVRQRLAGYLLAVQIFPTRESFEAYEKVSSPYDFSPVMLETMDAVWKSRGDVGPPPIGRGGAGDTDVDRRSRGTTIGTALAPGEPPLEAPGAVSILDEQPNLTPFYAGALSELVKSSNPDSLYNQRYDAIQDYFARPREEVYDQLINDKFVSRGELRAQTQFGRQPLNLAAMQRNLLAALDAARDEAEAKRRRDVIEPEREEEEEEQGQEQEKQEGEEDGKQEEKKQEEEQ